MPGERITFYYKTMLHAAREQALRADENSLDPISSIIFSVAALEAFLNDMIAVVEFTGSQPFLDIDVNRQQWENYRATLRSAADKNDLGVKAKLAIHLTGIVFRGKAFDEGSEPFQSIATVIRLRNELVHIKSELVKVGEQDNLDRPKNVTKLLEELERRGLREPRPMFGEYWTTHVNTYKIAAWAYNSVVDMINELVTIFPVGVLSLILKLEREAIQKLPANSYKAPPCQQVKE